MHLILLERVEGLGNVGDEVQVKAGFGRNFLLPQGKAIAANAANRKIFERQREQLEAKHRSDLEQAQKQAEAMGSLDLSVIRSTSDGQNLYGSVSTAELAGLLEEAGQNIERRFILLDEPIKTIGEHQFRVRLHPDVVASLNLKVVSDQAA